MIESARHFADTYLAWVQSPGLAAIGARMNYIGLVLMLITLLIISVEQLAHSWTLKEWLRRISPFYMFYACAVVCTTAGDTTRIIFALIAATHVIAIPSKTTT